jgi:hypothetical protein
LNKQLPKINFEVYFMLKIKNRVMATTIATVGLLAVAAPASLLTPAAEAAAVSTVTVKQSVSGNLIADRYDDDYEYSERHGRHIYKGRHRRHHHKNYQYSSSYQTPAVIYNKPVGLYAPPPQVIYAPAPQEKRCVRTLYSTICN